MKARLLGFALLITACSPATKAAQPNPQAPTTVKIENDNVQDMDVFVLSNGLRMRLGLVSGGHTEVFTLPATVVTGSSQVRFELRPIAGGARPRTETITVMPGDQVVLMIPPS